MRQNLYPSPPHIIFKDLHLYPFKRKCAKGACAYVLQRNRSNRNSLHSAGRDQQEVTPNEVATLPSVFALCYSNLLARAKFLKSTYY